MMGYAVAFFVVYPRFTQCAQRLHRVATHESARKMCGMQPLPPPLALTAKRRLAKTLLWGLAISTLLVVFASYGQLALLLQWVELKLC
jgi:hypothetical protein